MLSHPRLMAEPVKNTSNVGKTSFAARFYFMSLNMFETGLSKHGHALSFSRQADRLLDYEKLFLQESSWRLDAFRCMFYRLMVEKRHPVVRTVDDTFHFILGQHGAVHLGKPHFQRRT